MIDAQARYKISQLESGRESITQNYFKKRSSEETNKGYPIGAVITIDKKARSQISRIEKGMKPAVDAFRNALREGIINAVDSSAAKKVKELRRKLSMMKVSNDE